MIEDIFKTQWALWEWYYDAILFDDNILQFSTDCSGLLYYKLYDADNFSSSHTFNYYNLIFCQEIKLLLHWRSFLTMSMTLTIPDEKTMALGGVATGNMKAKDVAMAAGNMKKSGLSFKLRDWKKRGKKLSELLGFYDTTVEVMT